MRFVYSSRFDKDLIQLVKKNQILIKKINKTITLFEKNPEHPSLRLHKLAGNGNYSVSVDMSLRVIFHWENDVIYLLRIGKHEEVY